MGWLLLGFYFGGLTYSARVAIAAGATAFQTIVSAALWPYELLVLVPEFERETPDDREQR